MSAPTMSPRAEAVKAIVAAISSMGAKYWVRRGAPDPAHDFDAHPRPVWVMVMDALLDHNAESRPAVPAEVQITFAARCSDASGPTNELDDQVIDELTIDAAYMLKKASGASYPGGDFVVDVNTTGATVQEFHDFLTQGIVVKCQVNF